jgi:hypothetical protein
MDVDVLFAGLAVTDFEEAQAWYDRFFGRVPDIVANDKVRLRGVVAEASARTRSGRVS